MKLIRQTLPLICLSAVFGGCDDDADEAGAPEAVEIRLPFTAVADGAPVRCGEAITELGVGASTAQLRDLRMYVSEIALINASGDEIPVTLSPSDWQTEALALLDFEDGAGACEETGTPEMNTELVGSVPPGEYVGVTFSVGVPDALNHLDSAAAESPLNLGSMYWSWQTGYKFLRFDLAVEETPWFVHLGSTVCDRDEASGDTSCQRSNRPRITLTGADPLTHAVQLDVAALLQDSNVSENLPDSPPGCMSSPMEPEDCVSVFEGLGMDFEAGACEGGCGGQRLFTWAE